MSLGDLSLFVRCIIYYENAIFKYNCQILYPTTRQPKGKAGERRELGSLCFSRGQESLSPSMERKHSPFLTCLSIFCPALNLFSEE